jgi:cell division protein FtsI (penicillin-binding protein 3)
VSFKSPIEARPQRILYLLLIVAIAWLILFLRTFFVQVIEGSHYAALVRRQSERRDVLIPERGRIYDRNERVLADNFDGQKMNSERVKNRFRIYPNGSVASHILGNVGWNGRGAMGVEYTLDRELYGIEGWRFSKVDARRRKTYGFQLDGQDPVSGIDVYLTIDMDIQDAVEASLKEKVHWLKARSASAIVIEPSTGDILALANYPSFDANFIREKGSVFKNEVTQKIFEPGSTFKLFTAAAALEEKLFAPSDSIDAQQGQLRVFGDIIRDTQSYGMLTFSQAMAFSSNVVFAKVAQALGNQLFFKYVRSFGFGMSTGIDLPGEEKGNVKEIERWSGRTLSTMAMGHEILVTPIQLIMATAAFANQGYLMRPRLIRELRSRHNNEVIREFQPRRVRRVVSPETAEKIKEMMVGVVEFGTARNIQSKLISTSGKTGTAEKYDVELGRYDRGKNVATFAGFAPADRPQYVILVVVDEPQTYTTGGRTAGVLFKDIAEKLLQIHKMKICF